MNILNGKRITLGVCGSIAAYKVVELARNLTLAGAQVDVVMTDAAQRLVGPSTFQALTGRPVLNDMWEAPVPEESRVAHIALAMAADVVVIAPATANTIARMAAGIADDLLTTIILATTAPVLCAPAMNVQMYAAPATQDNIATLRRRGVVVVEPDEGQMAEPVSGKGRLPEPAVLEGEIRALLGRHTGPLRGRSVVVTAGGTREPIDPVRYVGNRSSGAMGYALAAAARDRGADVTLISGPTAIAPPAAMRFVAVETAIQMRDAVQSACAQADVLIMNAAVADYRPLHFVEQKIKKQGGEGLILELVPNPDILGELAQRRDVLKVGFAAETNDLLDNASAKLQRKGLHMIIVNEATASIGQPDIQVTLLDEQGGVVALPRQPKHLAAETLLDAIVDYLDKNPLTAG